MKEKSNINDKKAALIKIGEAYLEGFKKGYFQSIEIKYSSLDEEDSTIFPLIELNEYLNFNVILLNSDFFDFSYHIIILDNSENVVIDKTDVDLKGNRKFINSLGDFDHYKYIRSLYESHSNKFFTTKIMHGVERTLEKLNEYTLDEKSKDSYQEGLKDGSEYAGLHFVEFDRNMNEPLDQQNHEQSIFNILRIDDMIGTVKDENYEYQMKEAVSVYENKHYLPAAATFCVALETLLIIFKKRKGEKHKPSDSSNIKDLLELFSSKQLIHYRENKRLDIAYNLRNTINHSNIGMVAREDCLFIINTMRTFIDDHRDVFNQSS